MDAFVGLFAFFLLGSVDGFVVDSGVRPCVGGKVGSPEDSPVTVCAAIGL